MASISSDRLERRWPVKRVFARLEGLSWNTPDAIVYNPFRGTFIVCDMEQMLVHEIEVTGVARDIVFQDRNFIPVALAINQPFR